MNCPHHHSIFVAEVLVHEFSGGGKNQPFAMPVWERRIFFKKPLASGRIFDIFFAPFRPKD
jgi:hypothetical protein